MASHKNTLSISLRNTALKTKQVIYIDSSQTTTLPSSEIWLIPKDVIKISNYSIHRKYGSTSANKSRGGVLIAVHKNRQN